MSLEYDNYLKEHKANVGANQILKNMMHMITISMETNHLKMHKISI